MKKSMFLAFLLYPLFTFSQNIDSYFEGIRNSKVKLTAFFTQMPKGGDLHHHFSGSVYAETYIKYIVDNDLYINVDTYDVSREWLNKSYVRASNLKVPSFSFYRQKLLERWSVKDYNGVSQPSDKLFFATFPFFGLPADSTLNEGLIEIKARAKAENVSYIETMFSRIQYADTAFLTLAKANNGALRALQAARDSNGVAVLLEKIYDQIDKKKMNDSVRRYNDELTNRHKRLEIDDSSFTLRYQNYALRLVNNPVMVLKDLLTAFKSAAGSPLIVGVNIVGAEDEEVSMNDYWLHMQMFKFCHKKDTSVKYSMHAGELALGMVKPEDLSWHINAAVFEAGANRIGHGVDMAYEKDSPKLLAYMRGHRIPIEINLVSNEFILKVKNDDHPIILYKNAGVPIVIATDDAGVLRSNFAQQYVLLASRYPEFSYSAIKELVFNSIRYSFIEELAVRRYLTDDLKKRFSVFESSVLAGTK